MTKNRCRKKAPPITQTTPYDHGPGLPDSTPSRARFLNKKQQFEQQQQQQQQQLQPLWLDVDFVVNFIVFFITFVKNTCCSLQNPKADDLTRPGQGPANFLGPGGFGNGPGLDSASFGQFQPKWTILDPFGIHF